MKWHHVMVVISCFLVVGCFSQFRNSRSELQAQNHMDRAEALEDAAEYHQAAREYSIVAERYPSTHDYKIAVWKAAVLNMHPANSEIDYRSALHWLQVYLGLPLSPEEKDRAVIYKGLLVHIDDLESILSAFAAETEKRGVPLDVAISIGVHPVILIASVVTAPREDKIAMASSLLASPINMVSCETVDLEVPADAEITIEGRVLPNIREPEGPFGENRGVFRWTCGHYPRDCFPGDERVFPGGVGLRRGGLGQPAGHRHAAVLEKDDGQGHHRLRHRGHGLGGGHYPFVPQHVR